MGRVGTAAGRSPIRRFALRTTIELKDDLRSRLLQIAARRGVKGFSKLIEVAVRMTGVMERPKGRRIAIVVTVLGFATAASAVFLLRGPIAERWCLHKLEMGTAEEKLAAIEKLGMVGSEAALIRLQEQLLLQSPPGEMRIGLRLLIGMADVASGQGGVETRRPLGAPLLRAIARIERRIGPEREVASYLRVIESQGADPRKRAYLSAYVILRTSDPAELGDLGEVWGAVLAEYPSLDWRGFTQERAAVIKSLVRLMAESDELCRDTAIQVASWCRPEAAVIIPALEEVGKNSDQHVQRLTDQALKKILWR
jgi:hypothetical protein